MTKISRRKLDSATEKRIYEIFVQVIADARTKKDVQSLLEDFFTYSERIMLPKRLCIAYLLIKGYDYKTIISYLNVSSTTINRVSGSLKMDGNGYSLMLSRLQKQEQFSKTLKTIEDGVINLLASFGGKTQAWRHLRNERRKETYKNRKSF